jgi:hypothetical protein
MGENDNEVYVYIMRIRWQWWKGGAGQPSMYDVVA